MSLTSDLLIDLAPVVKMVLTVVAISFKHPRVAKSVFNISAYY
jgi:hypothetical protein